MRHAPTLSRFAHVWEGDGYPDHAGKSRWADAHLHRTGRWPSRSSGPIEDAPGETWSTIDHALKTGNRGLAGGTSLTLLLAQHRGRRNQRNLPVVTVTRILDWADAHFRRTGDWPSVHSGPVVDSPSSETWSGIDNALTRGLRGFPGGSSVAKLLQKHRGQRNRRNLPPLSASRIVRWAKAHFRRTGRWPSAASGPIAEAPGENWHGVQHALVDGRRGLPGGSALARFLVEHRCKSPHGNMRE
jgi:hypothetical protein